MSNQQEKEDSPFQLSLPLLKRPELGALVAESHSPASIDRPTSLPLSHVRGNPPVARSHSPAADLDPPNLVVSDRAEPDHDRSTSSRSLYGPLRGRSSLRDRPHDAHDPYDVSRYHAIHNNARTSYPANSNTTMNNSLASNHLPDTSGFVHSARGYLAQYSLRPAPFEWNSGYLPGHPYPYSNYLQGQPIVSPAATSAAVPTTRVPTAPVLPTVPAAPAAAATRSTRFRTQKRTPTAIKEPIKKPAARKPAAKKSAAKKSTAKRPWVSRSGFGILRPNITEVELASIRSDYGTLLPRKKSFKRASPGAFVACEITIGEIQLLWSNRDNGAEERKAYYDNPKAQEMQEATKRASLSYEASFERKRAKARRDGFPNAMPLEDRFPVVSLAAAATSAAPVVALIVSGNTAESTEDQEMLDDDSASSECSFFSASEGEGKDEDEDECMEEE